MAALWNAAKNTVGGYFNPVQENAVVNASLPVPAAPSAKPIPTVPTPPVFGPALDSAPVVTRFQPRLRSVERRIRRLVTRDRVLIFILVSIVIALVIALLKKQAKK